MARSNRSRYRGSVPRARSVKGYTLRGRNGRVRYVGVTNSPSRRAAEHKQASKTGRMKVETRRLTRASAQSWERQKLAAHRRNHGGKNPPLNKTRSGGRKY